MAHAEPFADDAAASKWLSAVRRDRGALATELAAALAILNRMLRAHRAVVADPFVREVRGELASARRVGYGEGVAIAGGRLDASVDLPPEDEARRGRRGRMSPQERLAATLGGRAHVLACEELLLRARLDLDARRGREAALQARIALETLLAELASDPALNRDRGDLEADRVPLAEAANAALDAELDDTALTAVRGAVEHMERVMARRRATGG